MGEITFLARQLTETELREIIFAGHTFESIAAGRIPYVPKETGFDKAFHSQKSSFVVPLYSICTRTLTFENVR